MELSSQSAIDIAILNQKSNAKRVTLEPEMEELMLSVVAQLEQELSNPPTLLDIQLRLKRDNSEILAKHNIMIIKWAVTALFFTNKVYSSKC